MRRSGVTPVREQRSGIVEDLHPRPEGWRRASSRRSAARWRRCPPARPPRCRTACRQSAPSRLAGRASAPARPARCPDRASTRGVVFRGALGNEIVDTGALEQCAQLAIVGGRGDDEIDVLLAQVLEQRPRPWRRLEAWQQRRRRSPSSACAIAARASESSLTWATAGSSLSPPMPINRRT